MDEIIDTANIMPNAGKQTAQIAIQNANIIASHLRDEAMQRNQWSLGYALDRLIEYLQAAEQ